MLDGQRKMELVCSHKDQPEISRCSNCLAANVSSLEDSYATVCVSAITIECTVFLQLIQQRKHGRFTAVTSNTQLPLGSRPPGLVAGYWPAFPLSSTIDPLQKQCLRGCFASREMSCHHTLCRRPFFQCTLAASRRLQ